MVVHLPSGDALATFGLPNPSACLRSLPGASVQALVLMSIGAP
jgi:hypothetical protein